MNNAGPNKGLSGTLVNWTAPGQTANFPAVSVQITDFDFSFLPTLVEFTGPGAAFNKQIYSTNTGGETNFSGKVQSSQAPFPAILTNLKGTLVFQKDTNCTVSYPATISMLTCSRHLEEEDTWVLSAQGVKNGAPSLAWNGSVQSYSPVVPTAQETNAGTMRTFDPNSLIDAANQRVFYPLGATCNGSESDALITSYIAGIGSPLPDLKLHHSTFERIDDAAGWLNIIWSTRDTSDEALFPKTSEFRSPRGFTEALGSLVLSSGTPSDQADTLWGVFQSVPFAIGMTLEPYTPNYRIATYQKLNPGVTVEGWTTGGGRLIEAKLSGSNPQVYIVANDMFGTGCRRLVFSKQRLFSSALRRFVIWRHITGTTIPEQYPSTIDSVTMPAIGNVNSTTFLGLATKTVIYEGPTYVVNLALATPFPIFIGYQFYTDSNGIIEGIPDRLTTDPWYLGGYGSTTSGWTNVSGLGAPFTDIVTPATASFDAFTS